MDNEQYHAIDEQIFREIWGNIFRSIQMPSEIDQQRVHYSYKQLKMNTVNLVELEHNLDKNKWLK